MDVSIWSLVLTHTPDLCLFCTSVFTCLLWDSARCMWTMSGWPVLGKEAALVSWLSSTVPPEQPQSELRPTWSCGASTETATGEYLWWADERVKVSNLQDFSFVVSPAVLFFLTRAHLHFSVGKHFKKEEDVRGIPPESIYFRWDDQNPYV